LELVGRWGAEGCTGFERLPVSGLPAEWCLFRADGAHSDDLVRQSLPMLAFPSTLRLRFDGGVRHAGGPWYFRFAPPRITVEGSAMNVELTCNGAALRRDLDTGSFVLPPNLTGGPQYKVEAHMGDRIARRNLFLLDDFPLPAHLPVRWFDRHDQQLPEDSEPCVGYAGALARHPFEARFPYENLLPLSGSAKVYLLGRKPDEVRVWPRDPLPREWSPIWAIRAGKHCEAIFCGTGLDEAGPQALPPGGRPHAEWKEALWFLRKRTAPPHHRALHALLRLYQEVARRV
jgi:hypothetical protein